LTNRRAINLPGRRVSAPVLAERDFEAIDYALAAGVDFLALSFVQSVNDVVHLKRLLRESRG
jgi:pyruvate kinase